MEDRLVYNICIIYLCTIVYSLILVQFSVSLHFVGSDLGEDDKVKLLLYVVCEITHI